MPKLVISGYYGFDNLGDEAVLAGCVKGFREIKNNIDITVLSNDPQTTEQRYDVRAIPRNNIKMVYKTLKNSDLFLSGGGSLLQDIVGWKSIPYYLGQVMFAKILRNKTVFYAQGIGPVSNSINKKLIKWVANQCNLITLRDQTSRKLLLNYGVNNQLIKVYADPVFILEPKGNGDYFTGPEPHIGIAVRPWGNNQYLESLLAGIEHIVNKLSAKAVIIPLHYHQDREISRELKERLKCEVSVLEGRYTPEEMINIFSSLDFCIGVRLHSLIFTALSKIPFVGISYDPKVTAFLKGMGINNNLNINNLNEQLLIKEIEDVWQNRENFILNTADKIKHYRELAYENVREVLSLV